MAEIKEAEFLMSNQDYKRCPKPDRPEYAFIGRSNVGKSSLINMLTGRNALAKTSSKPGKTQLINHFSIDQSWYLVDLPGYGYAKVSKKLRGKFKGLIYHYLENRENLMCVFVLIDSRIPPQKLDLEFMAWLGKNHVPFVMCFTKAEKLKPEELEANLKTYEETMYKDWAFLPDRFVTSAISGMGKEEVTGFIQETNKLFKS